jgi:hypothetical protein
VSEETYGGGTRKRRRGLALPADLGVAAGEGGTGVELSLTSSPGWKGVVEAVEGIDAGEASGLPNDHRVVVGSGPSGLPKAGLRALRNSV